MEKFNYKKYKEQIKRLKDSWLCKIPIAHRGLHNEDAPENSLKAFQNAVDKNYAIELDIHLLKDGNIAVFHDNSLKRVCGENVMISSLTTEELKKYKINGTDQTIPTLDEVMELVDGKVPLLVELKSFRLNGKLEEALYNKLKNYKGEYAIEAFNPFSISWFKNNAPEFPRGQLLADCKFLRVDDFISNLILNSKATMPHFVATSTSGVDKIQNGDKPLLTWTVKTKEQYDKVMKYCDNAIFEKFNPLKAFTHSKV